ncbi:MAG: outer membrane protein assembly factor BamE [Proteobacteria bacterium]|nr:outer membrane protein assembly factor BamE [Pseudomonadota bacterium]
MALTMAVASTVLMTGCARTVNHRGYLIDEDIVQEIRPGVDNRASVSAALGTPSVKPAFDEDTWFYVSRTQENWAFFKPDVTEHQVIVVSFDESGNVASIERLGMDDTQKVDLIDKTTPTRGKELGFFEQIFSNIGRFSGPGPAQAGN